MAETKKKGPTLFTHWARPRVRMYEYNYEYGESYYRPLVRYISTSRASYEASTSSTYSSTSSYESKKARLERRRRAASPPGALSFIERWANEPFYGYGVGFRSRLSSERTFGSSSAYNSSSSAAYNSSSSAAYNSSYSSQYESSRSLRAQSVAAVQQSTNIRSSRARSVESAARYASDDCLMRSNALRSARAASAEIMNTQSLCKNTLCLDNQNVLHGRTLDERHYLNYPKQHLVCDETCPLHNCPEWRRRFLIGNRFSDAAALGGFDVLYDPTVYKNSRRLLSKLAERSESESDEILIQRSSESESSRRKLRATSYFA